MYVSSNVNRSYVCDPWGLYISAIINFIDNITLIGQT